MNKKSVIYCITLSLAILIVDIFVPLGVAVSVLYLIVILFSLSHLSDKWTLTFLASSCLLTVVGIFLSPPGGELFQAIANRSISLIAILTTGSLGMQRNKIVRQHEEILREKEQTLSEIKILRGLLPICASCKKIRDDQGLWKQIEHYISSHSEAEFSHGICPECAKKLYPVIDL